MPTTRVVDLKQHYLWSSHAHYRLVGLKRLAYP
ncbi:hypothetical protein A2U01_0095838, partial [Trifolium medium]|nr:hypothetical protein [Trifolium medium]